MYDLSCSPAECHLQGHGAGLDGRAPPPATGAGDPRIGRDVAAERQGGGRAGEPDTGEGGSQQDQPLLRFSCQRTPDSGQSMTAAQRALRVTRVMSRGSIFTLIFELINPRQMS